MVILHYIDMPIFTFDAGFSVNHGAVQRWTLDASYWAKIREVMHDMVYYKNAINIHHDLSPKQIQRHEEDVKAIMILLMKILYPHLKSKSWWAYPVVFY